MIHYNRQIICEMRCEHWLILHPDGCCWFAFKAVEISTWEDWVIEGVKLPGGLLQ